MAATPVAAAPVAATPVADAPPKSSGKGGKNKANLNIKKVGKQGAGNLKVKEENPETDPVKEAAKLKTALSSSTQTASTLLTMIEGPAASDTRIFFGAHVDTLKTSLNDVTDGMNKDNFAQEYMTCTKPNELSKKYPEDFPTSAKR